MNELHETLKSLLETRDLVRLGRLQILSVEKIKDRLGDDWPRFSATVHRVAEAAIKRALGPKDVHLEVGGCGYILVFAELDGERAQLRMMSLMRQILTQLFGEAADDPDFADLVGAHASAIEVSKDVLDRDPELLDFGQAHGGNALPPIPPGAVAEPGADENYDRHFSWAGSGTQQLQPERLEWQFAPLWDVPHRALTTYLCDIVSIADRENQPIDVDWLLSQRDDPRIGHLDAQMLSRTAQELKEIAIAKHKVLIACRVHYYTLDSKTRRQAYLRQFRHLPENHQRFLILELCGLPPGTPPSRAHQLVSELRPHARMVVLRLNMAEASLARLRPHSLNQYKEAGFDAVALDAAPLRRDERQLVKLLDAFAAAAATASLRACVLGLTARSATMAAIVAGCDYIQSDAIMSPVAKPSYMLRYDLPDLFA
ncbi:hypothetical protein ACFOGJ_12785 [Marinibaculum pumilum]|uniref:EAL domain-containing protein n=1 Tax=Marinibaculum pumilum TaxID=1766165 RepID=A0ABV7L111_9PROT